jgi:hypothetical protein
MATELPFTVHLKQFGRSWMIEHNGEPMGMAVNREGAIDIALRLSRSLVSDHLDPSQFRLEGAEPDELMAGAARLRAWLNGS